ncbi:hypothetical protein [Silvimonas iriomotensis]|uniref:Uncharacterized protein n=1 Tax=Silvimonas iriomotensis TaxID=449662 RepID=A0ABQ2PFS6_9NEIS|nr:hypothetical protein [Silvimonas iriomotensis]GGP24044.1 hypothetical protein GCM10010970_40440 [Silvimonas iriomotensis]
MPVYPPFSELPVDTDIPPYGIDERTESAWQWLQMVGQLVAKELAVMPRGTLALVEETDSVYWVVAIEDQLYLATAAIFEGEILLEHAALLRTLAALSIEELTYQRMALEAWLLSQPTMRLADTKRLQMWDTLPKAGGADWE